VEKKKATVNRVKVHKISPLGDMGGCNALVYFKLTYSSDTVCTVSHFTAKYTVNYMNQLFGITKLIMQ